MNSPMLSYQVRADGLAVVTFDVPGQPVNSLQVSFGKEFETLLDRLETDPSIKAAIILSGKPTGWVVGANLDMLKHVQTAAEAEHISKLAQQAFRRLEALPKPVIAAIHGAALGGGLELALACHGRVITDDPRTVLGLPEVQLGLVPGGNGLQRLARIVGLQNALDLALTGKNVRPSRARRLGLADDVVRPSILLQAAVDLAHELVAQGGHRAEKKGLPRITSELLTQYALEKNPIGRRLLFSKARETVQKRTFGHYPAPGHIIDILELYAEQGLDASCERESHFFGQLVMSQVSRQLIGLFQASTALKKDPGVDNADVRPRPVRQIGMLGGGLMGAGISFVSMQNAGIAVRLKERDTEGLARATHLVHELYDEKLRKRQLSRGERAQKLALLTASTDYSGYRQVDLVIEAVFEDLELKQQVLREVEQNCSPETIFASNTSSIPIGRIALAASRPHMVLGMHYFSPVQKMPLLEVIRTEQTAPWVIATAVELGKKQGKTVIVVKDGVGFYTSRILAPLMNEASYILAEGVRVEDIDNAMRAWGWPVGPIKLLDEVGIDVAAHVAKIMAEAFGSRIIPPRTMAKLLADGRKGRKNQRGFYLYEDKRRNRAKHVDITVYTALGIEPKTRLAAEEIQMRCSLQFVNEALRCLQEGILRSPRDGDIGAVLGLGFPPFRGGPFRYVDAIGAKEVLRRIRAYQDRFGARWEPAPLLVEIEKSGRKFYE